jgi:hypothetical protein
MSGRLLGLLPEVRTRFQETAQPLDREEARIAFGLGARAICPVCQWVKLLWREWHLAY